LAQRQRFPGKDIMQKIGKGGTLPRKGGPLRKKALKPATLENLGSDNQEKAKKKKGNRLSDILGYT